MVPEGWVHTTFGEHIDCLTGFAFKSSGYSANEEDVRLLRGDNIEPGNLRWNGAKFWPSSELDSLERYHLLEGDFVIAMDRTWITAGLKVAEIQKSDLPCLLVQRVARVRARASLEQSLLRQYFSGNRFGQYVKSVQTATAVPHISPNDIKEFSVALPPLPEQKKIAQILSTWDKAITTTGQLLVNSQQQKKALMQQLLTGPHPSKPRLLDENGVRFGGEWETVKISEVCDVRRGASPRPIKDPKWFSNSGRGWIRISDVTASPTNQLLHTTQYLSDEGASSSVCVDPGDLVMSICGTIGVPKFIGIPACIHDGFVVFRKCKKGLVLDFLYHYLDFISEILASGGQPGTQKNLNTSIVGNTRMPWVSSEEQQKIASILSTADQEITVLQNKLSVLKQEKKALMQQLLTGKRRVIN
tara:strand:+ start:615 stop:1859 length:1245 start_codon:yes stop_codon:yes gene_type:complete